MSKADRASVTLKIATSLDGRIATSTGESQWITGPESRECVHKLRATHSAIIVGADTALADDPMLTARTTPPTATQPVRIVADSRLRTPLTSKLATTTGEARTVLASGLDIEEDAERPFLALGVEVWSLPIAPAGGVSVTAISSRCAEEGLDTLFIEGGGRLAASFLQAGLIDRIEWFRAPIILGGDGLPCVATLGLEALAEAPKFRRESIQESGADIWETYVAISQDQE